MKPWFVCDVFSFFIHLTQQELYKLFLDIFQQRKIKGKLYI